MQERELLIRERIRIATQQKDLARQLPLHKSSYAEFMDLLRQCLPEIIESNISESTRELLVRDWSMFDKFSGTLEAWQARVDQDQDELWKHESRFRLKEKAVYDAISNSHHAVLTQHSRTTSSSHAPSTEIYLPIRRPTSEASSTDSDEDEYYYAIGKINLLRDKIFNLESAFRQQRLIREAELDDIQTPAYPGDEMFKDYIRGRKHIIEDYVKAKTAMELSGERCREKGLEVDPPNLPAFLDQMFSTEHDAFLEAEKKHFASADDVESRVLHWRLQTLQGSNLDYLDLSGIDPQAQSGKESLSPTEQLKNGLSPLGNTWSKQTVEGVEPATTNPSDFHAESLVAGRRWSNPELRPRRTGGCEVILRHCSRNIEDSS